MSLNRYAYLIIADKNINQVQELITMLDDSRNDIYLLVDNRSNLVGHKFNVSFSSLYYVKPINIYWGSYSQIQAELNLFRAAFENKNYYTYYHLLSGQDLPLVNQDKIHNFFDSHKGYEFIQYQSENDRDINDKLNNHFFTHHFDSGIHSDRSNSSFLCKLLWSLYRKFETLVNKNFYEQKIPVDKVSTASNWISVDDKVIRLILRSSRWIYKKFHRGKVVDELFVPTLLNYYPRLINYIYDIKRYNKTPADPMSNLRYINKKCNSSHPSILTISDYKKLIEAKDKGYLFARKFDVTIDNVVVEKIFKDVMIS